MQPRPRTFLSILPLALLLSAAGWGQSTAISGDVKGVDGKPVVGALVKLERKDQKGSFKVKTDKKGHYYYGGLGLGVFDIAVEVDGKDMDSVKGVNTMHGDAVADFDLKKAAERTAAAAAGISIPTPEQERGMTTAQKAELEKKRRTPKPRSPSRRSLMTPSAPAATRKTPRTGMSRLSSIRRPPYSIRCSMWS